MSIRSGGNNYRLLLCACAERCGVQLTELKRENPMDAPMFCMLLRKHLQGGRILSIAQPNADRVVIFYIEARNEMGDPVTYRLIAEIMGKYSNIILVNESNIVVDAIKRVGLGVSNVRIVLPGLPYEEPPKQDKRDPLESDAQDFALAIDDSPRPDKALSAAFFGLSPSMASALLLAAGADKPAWIHGFYQRLKAGELSPHLLLNGSGESLGVYPFKPSDGQIQAMPTMGAAFDAYYTAHDIHVRSRQHGAQIRRVLSNNIARCEKKLALYNEAIASQESIEKLRICGDLLTANLFQLKSGMEEAVVQNFYDAEGSHITIPLDKQLSPNANAQRYYKKYQKAKAGREMALAQREQALAELAYLEGQMDNLDKCVADMELMEIREELRQEGYIRAERGKKQKLGQKSRPMRFLASDGTEILVGKNNRQNDELTLKTAVPSDIWLHTKEIPGSHVIVKSPDPSKETLYEAAVLAAWYSRARGGENIPVDYTQKKYVKKPAGAKPGMVIYTTNRTAYVTPDEAALKKLRQLD